MLQVRCRETEFSIGVFDHCVLVVWREITVVGIQQLMRTLQELRNENGDIKLALLGLVEAECTVPVSSDCMRASTDLLKRFEHNLLKNTVVYARNGFASATVRSQLMTSAADSKTDIPQIVTASLLEGCALTASAMEPALLPADVAEAVARLRVAPASSSGQAG